MKFSDLKVGEEYAFAKGKQDNERLFRPLRCILLSTEPCHNLDWRYPYATVDSETGLPPNRSSLEDYAVFWGAQPTYYERGKGYVKPRQRVLVAVELPTYTKTDIDPVTGEPWFIDQVGRLRGEGEFKWIETGSVWVPYAALPSELRVPWSTIAAHVAAEKEARRYWNVRDKERAAKQAIEAERKRIENADRAKQYEKERQTRQEFYDQRIAPLLAEAGIDLDTEVRFDNSSSSTSIDTEALARLLRLMQEEQA